MCREWLQLLCSLNCGLLVPTTCFQLLDPGGDLNAAPQLELVKLDGRRYRAHSIHGAELNVSEDQFMYSFAQTEKYGFEFPSAWLMTRDKFLSTAPPESWEEHNIELNVFVPTGYDVEKAPRTVDFFDFMGVHLSFWADLAHIRGPAPPPESARFKVKSYFEDRLSNDVARFQKRAAQSVQNPSPLRTKTVALLPFAMSIDREGSGIAATMLNATFWSLKSQFDAVVLGACHPDDYELLMQFPAWRVIKLDGTYCAQNGGMYLLSHAMKALSGGLPDSQDWDHFQYVYYTEGDVLLHLREHERILEHLESADRALVPHRLDTFAAMGDFPETLKGVDEEPFLGFWIRKTSTPVSAVDFDSASCCFSGRVRSASEFWWTAKEAVSSFPLLKSVKFDGGLPITLASHGAPEVCEVAPRYSCR